MFPHRFTNKFTVAENGCWNWTGAKSRQGYGNFYYEGKIALAHRVAYAMSAGVAMPPPDEKVCHRCDNPACVNPGHLFLATQLINVRDMMDKGRGRKRGLPGSQNPRARLNQSEVDFIRASDRKVGELATIFGVAQSTISAIRLGVNWKRRA